MAAAACMPGVRGVDGALGDPARASYTSLYRWPESDSEFIRSSMKLGARKVGRSSVYGHPRVVDSYSCRQLYLRSYTFSRDDEEHLEKGKGVKWLGRVSKTADAPGGDRRPRRRRTTCSALRSVFYRILSCTTKIDVAT